MAWTRYNLAAYSFHDELIAVIRRNYPSIQEIVVSPDVRSLNYFVDIREKDFGVWEWNEEII